MSAIPIAGGAAPTSAATVWTSPDYTCSISLRVINTSSSPQTFSYYVAGINRGYAGAVPGDGSVDLEKGLKLPPNTAIACAGQTANTLYWSVSGIQNDGQP